MKIVSFVSQKGGVGKSSLARLLAVHAARQNQRVLIADLDLEQLSCVEWSAQRMRNGYEPEIDARPFKNLKKMRKSGLEADLVIVDTRGLADDLTEDVSSESDLVFLPTGTSMDDLRPTLALARKLARDSQIGKRIHLILSKVGKSERQLLDARTLIEDAGFNHLPPVWPQKDGYVGEFDIGRVGSESSNVHLRSAAEDVQNAMYALVRS